ncbi:MAG: hypothetical protein KDE19_04280 [Caldilineaceae bacterium]|nr:hypothetical protein [Caldilineaceae bacterium]
MKLIKDNAMSDAGEITVTLPVSLLRKLNESVPTPHQNLFIQRAIEELLAIEEQSQALAESAGAWSGEAYADLDSPEAVESWLQTLRSSWRTEDIADEPIVA